MAEDVSECVLVLSPAIRGRQRTTLSSSMMRHQVQLSVQILAAVRQTEHLRAKKNHCWVKSVILKDVLDQTVSIKVKSVLVDTITSQIWMWLIILWSIPLRPDL